MVNDEYSGLTNEEVVNKALRDNGDDWMVAALVEGSIGYHTPEHARIIIKEWRDGHRQDWCERCAACYAGDLATMMAHDVYGFNYKPKEKRDAVIEYCKAMEGRSWSEQMTGSMLYPDHPPNEGGSE